MIQAFHSEPRGQRQRFEPREQQRGEEQDRHIHLYVHLNLTFRASQGRSTPSNATRIMRIFAALFGGMFLDNMSSTLSVLAGIFLVGLALARGGGCFPLLVSAWRAIPRDRFVLLVRLLVPFFLLPLWVMPVLGGSVVTFFHLFWFLFAVHPLLSAILFAWVSHEGRVLRRTAPARSKRSLVIVSGMVLMLLAGLLLSLFALLNGGPLVSPLLFLPAMCAAVIVALCSLLGFSRLWVKTQARPKDMSPPDMAAARSRGYAPVDRNQEEKRQGEP